MADEKKNEATPATTTAPTKAAVVNPGIVAPEKYISKAQAEEMAARPAAAVKPKKDFAGRYVVKAFRITHEGHDTETLKHNEAHRGDVVRLSHLDAVSLLAHDAIETVEQFEARVEAERLREETKTLAFLSQ